LWSASLTLPPDPLLCGGSFDAELELKGLGVERLRTKKEVRQAPGCPGIHRSLDIGRELNDVE